MAVTEITVETGRVGGTRPSRRMRRAGRVPGVVYGMGIDPVVISVDKADLRAALTTDAGLNALITLDLDGARQLSIVKELQRHPVRRDVLHVDFLRISEHNDVEVEVPLVLTGEAKKVTQANGMVDQVLHRLPVLAKPADIPAEVHADVSALEVGDSLRVGDIDLPEGVTAAGDPDAPFAVGVITRSTKEYLRQLRASEDGVEFADLALGAEHAGDDSAAAGNSGEG